MARRKPAVRKKIVLKKRPVLGFMPFMKMPKIERTMAYLQELQKLEITNSYELALKKLQNKLDRQLGPKMARLEMKRAKYLERIAKARAGWFLRPLRLKWWKFRLKKVEKKLTKQQKLIQRLNEHYAAVQKKIAEEMNYKQLKQSQTIKEFKTRLEQLNKKFESKLPKFKASVAKEVENIISEFYYGGHTRNPEFWENINSRLNTKLKALKSPHRVVEFNAAIRTFRDMLRSEERDAYKKAEDYIELTVLHPQFK